jgi:DNA-binding response OmpR family regulator
MHSVLFIEDEPDLGNVVKQYLEMMDFDIDWCKDGIQALKLFRENYQKYSILLLDVSLPGMDGFELARNIIKINSNVPFLFLTARIEKQDKLLGLKIGADDYITKPFDIDELILRIKNIIKRNQQDSYSAAKATTTIKTGDVIFYKDSLILAIANEETMLTPKEAELLEYLFKNANRILKREEILTHLWGGNDYFLGRSMDVFISRLRKHLSKSHSISINNVYGIGYVFNVK